MNYIIVFSIADWIHCFAKLVFHSLSTRCLTKKYKKSATQWKNAQDPKGAETIYTMICANKQMGMGGSQSSILSNKCPISLKRPDSDRRTGQQSLQAPGTEKISRTGEGRPGWARPGLHFSHYSSKPPLSTWRYQVHKVWSNLWLDSVFIITL